MANALHEGRIDRVPYERSVGVVTAWDLGVGDSTAIWFAQFVGPEIRLIDYYDARILQEKGYIYEQHILPHDVRVRELGSGRSRLEVLDNLRVTPVQIAPQLNVDDGIQAVRSMIDLCYFDKDKCGHHIVRMHSDTLPSDTGRPQIGVNLFVGILQGLSDIIGPSHWRLHGNWHAPTRYS